MATACLPSSSIPSETVPSPLPLSRGERGIICCNAPQRPVFNSVHNRVYWRSTSGGITASANSLACTSAGG